MRFLWLLIFLATSALAQTGTWFIGSVNARKDIIGSVSLRIDGITTLNSGDQFPETFFSNFPTHKGDQFTHQSYET